jgi:hypothetical protein
MLGAAGVLGLSLVPRVRPYTRHVALIAVGLSAVLILMFRWVESVPVVRSLWQPSLLFGSALTWQADVPMQPLAFVLSLVTWCSVLVGLSRGEAPRPRLTAASLAVLSAGLVALWSANVLTLVVSWAMYDFVQTAATIAAGGSARTAIRSMVLGNLATLLLWTGAALSGGRADSELWSLMTFGETSLTLWAVAGMLRLWVYPFHLSAPDDVVGASPLVVLLLLGPIVGWGLWLRLSTASGASILRDAWVSALAAGTLTLGGLLAWSCESPRRSLLWVGIAANGALLLAAGLAGESAATVIILGSVSWTLGVVVFSLGDGWQRGALWWNVPALVGLLTLLGSPLTLGFVTAATLIGGLVQGSRIEGGMTFWGSLAGYLFLVPSLVRRLLTSPSVSLPDRRGMVLARGVGLGVPTLFLIVAGLFPSFVVVGGPSLGSLLAMPGLLGGVLWAIMLACGGLLAWQEGLLRSRIGLLFGAVHDVLRLEWLYVSVAGAFDRGLSIFRAVNDVVEGAGGLLWSLLLFLLLLLAWGGL